MQTFLSAIQPTNKITLGNYIGAIKQFVKYSQLNKNCKMYIFVADLHAITNTFKPDEIFENRKNVACIYQACGLDIKKIKIFFQSDVKAHTELEHILLCHTTLGELNRMTQFKDKAKKTSSNNTEFIPTGLLIYPVLMAADILLYDADYVIVGQDQKQHIELCRNIAIRMNNKYGNLFTIPKGLILENGARIMDLQNPLIKMSKSNNNEKGTIFLLDDKKIIIDKIMHAKTDSFNRIKYDKIHQPGISNLIEIYSSISNISIEDIEEKYKLLNDYRLFKQDLSNIIANELIEIQKKFNKLQLTYETDILPILKENASFCNNISNIKMKKIFQAIGLRNN